MTAPTDRASLIIAAQSGNEISLSQLLKECRADVRRYARRHCEMSEIDDAVQETLLIVARRIRSLKAVTSFAGWLFAGRAARVPAPRAAHDLPRGLDRCARSRRNWRAARMIACVSTGRWRSESLPAHYLEIVLLRDFEELSIAEIGARLGAPASLCQARLHRARVLVREYLIGGDPAPHTAPADRP